MAKLEELFENFKADMESMSEEELFDFFNTIDENGNEPEIKNYTNMEHFTIKNYFTKLVESVGDKYPNLTVEDLVKVNEKLKLIQGYMLNNYTEISSHWLDFNNNMVSFTALSNWVDELKKNGMIRSVFYNEADGTPYLEAYEIKPRTLEQTVESYTNLNNALIKEAITLVNKEMPTLEIQNEYNNLTRELDRLTKKVTEMRDKYVL